MKTTCLSILIFIIWIFLAVDGCVAFADTGLIGIVLIGSVLGFAAFFVINLFSKKYSKSISCALFAATTVFGFLSGVKILDHQYNSAIIDLEIITEKIDEIKKKEGKYPSKISEIMELNESRRLPIGFLRKRQLYYSVSQDEKYYELWFPYYAFTIAHYSSENEKWTVED